MSPRPQAIYPFATARLTQLAGPRGSFDRTLLSYTALYELGRNAIHWGLWTMGLEPGSRVWMPAFHCGVEVQAVLDLGLDVGFYRVDRDLRIDMADLARRLDEQPGPVVAIHYYGFPQPEIEALVAMCEQRSVPLVEDCSHALYSKFGQRPLGEFGQVATFSFYKSMPLVCGGGLNVNWDGLERVLGRPARPLPPRIRSARPLKIWLKSRSRKVLGGGVTKLYRRLRYGNPKQPASNNHWFGLIGETPEVRVGRMYPSGMAAFTRAFGRTLNVENVPGIRRANYLRLEQALRQYDGCRPVFESLPKGVCPFGFPIWTRERTGLIERLAERQIQPFVFGFFAHPAMDQALADQMRPLRDGILCLPVHQHLSPEQIDRMARELGPLLSEYGATV